MQQQVTAKDLAGRSKAAQRLHQHGHMQVMMCTRHDGKQGAWYGEGQQVGLAVGSVGSAT